MSVLVKRYFHTVGNASAQHDAKLYRLHDNSVKAFLTGINDLSLQLLFHKVLPLGSMELILYFKVSLLLSPTIYWICCS